MCLAAFALGQHPRYALLLAANRDEFFAREAEPLAWRDAGLGGVDRQAGGHWLLLDREGRLALVTNVREPGQMREGLASRGELPARAPAGEALDRLASEPRNGFNLLRIAARAGQAEWASNRPGPRQQLLGPGLYGLSNAALDTPWPKTELLKQRLAQALELAAPEQALFAALADTRVAADGQLPSTGMSLERERALSSAFIRIAGPDGLAVYGTRCATVVIAEREGDGLRISVRERRFGADGRVAGESQEVFFSAA